MDGQAVLDAEERLAEFFMLPLFAREASWAEIAEDLIPVCAEPPVSSCSQSPPLPAPITLRWPALRAT